MADDWLYTRFLFVEEFDSEFVETFLNYCLDIGCNTHQDGSTDTCDYRDSSGAHQQGVPTAGAIRDIASHQKGRIELWYKDLRIDLKFNPNDRKLRNDIPLIKASVFTSQFKLYDKYPKAEVQDRVNQMIDFVVALAEFADPAFTYAKTEAADSPVDLTKTDLREGRPPTRLPWLAVFSDRMIEQIGRERLKNAPAWEVKELDTGSILLVVTNNPIHPDHDLSRNYYVVADHLGWETEGFLPP